MEFSERLAQMRRHKGLTQEQLADELHVSRTAISKWENGRGVPSIDSLQAIARFFGVTVDELLSANAVLDAALVERRAASRRRFRLASAWLSLAALACMLLPLYKSSLGGLFVPVPLYQLEGPLTLAFVATQLAMAACGAAALLAIKLDGARATTALLTAGDVLCAILVIALAATLQPYATCAFVALLISKLVIRIKFSQLTAS